MHLDLNARRHARAETLGDAPTFELGEDTFTLPHGIPLAVLELLKSAQLSDALAMLVGGAEQADRLLLVHGFDHLDAIDVIEHMTGLPLGEYLASTNSSTSTGERSRPTSRRTTGSTSPKPRTDKKR